MISINTSSTSTVKMTDRLVIATCPLGFSNPGTGLSGNPAGRPSSVVSLAGPVIRERNERATKAPGAVAAAQAKAYAFAAAGAGFRKQTQHHHTMWAFRGLEPWSDPT